MALLSHATELANVATYISKVGTDGRFRGIDIPRLVTAVEQPGGNAAIAALREHGSPQLRAALDAQAGEFQAATGQSLNDVAPHDEYSLGQFFIHPLAVRTGVEENHWTVSPGTKPSASSGLQLDKAGLPMSGQPLQTSTNEAKALPGGAVSSGGAPSIAGSEAEPIKAAAIANDFATANPTTFRSTADFSLPHFDGGAPVRDQGFKSVEGYVKQTLEDYHSAQSKWNDAERAQPGSGGPAPSLTEIGVRNLTYDAPKLDNFGNPTGQTVPTASLNGAQAAGAIDSLANIGDKLGLFGPQGSSSEQNASATIGGLGMALGAHAAMAALAPVLLGTGPAGWVVAAGIGIAAGLSSMGHKSDNSAQIAMQQERLRLQQQQFEEQMRRNSVTELGQRENAIARSVSAGSLTQQQRQQLLSSILGLGGSLGAGLLGGL